MGAKKITDNNMSQDALLRSVKAAVVSLQLDNSLKPNEKALAESIVETLLQKAESGNDYLLKLTSKNTDALMGRIETYIDKVKDDFTSNELENVKNAIIDAVQNATNDSPASIETSDIVDAVDAIAQKINAEIEKQIDKAISCIKDLFAEQADIAQAAAPAIAPVVVPAVAPAAAPAKEEKEEPAEDLSEFEADTDKDAFTEEDLNEIQEFITQQFTLLTKTIEGFNAQILSNINAVVATVKSLQDNLQSSINALQPTSKDKKNAKNQKKAQDEINKIIKQMDEAVKKLEHFADHLTDVLIKGFETFMNGVFKVLVAFTLKVLIAIIVPLLMVIGLFLYLLADPLMKVLQPIMDFIDGLVDKIKDVVIKALEFLEPVRDFIIDVLEKFVDAIMPAVKAFFKGLETVAEKVGKGLGLFVTAVLGVLTKLMNGIATGAFELGKALVIFATKVIKVLTLFMEGISAHAKAIGEGLGTFITVVLEVLAELMRGIGSCAYDIGVAIGKVVIALCDCAAAIAELVTAVATVLKNIINIIGDFFEGLRSKAKAIGEMISGIIYDFFEGFRTNAKKIGEKVSEIALVAADIILKILKGIDAALGGLRKFMLMYIIAPINAIKRKINVFLVQLAEMKISLPSGFRWKTYDLGITDISLPCGINWRDFYPFSGIKNGMDQDTIEQAKQDSSKSLVDIIGDEMNKMAEKIQKEEEAEKAAELARRLEQKKIEDMLNNVKLIEEMSNQVKDIHAKVMEQKEAQKIDFTEIINKVNASIEALVPKMQETLNSSLNEMVGPIVQALSENVDWFKERVEVLLDDIDELVQYNDWLIEYKIAFLVADLMPIIYHRVMNISAIIEPLPQIVDFIIGNITEKIAQSADKIKFNIDVAIFVLLGVTKLISHKIQQAKNSILEDISATLEKSEVKLLFRMFKLSQFIISSVSDKISTMFSPLLFAVKFGFTRVFSIFTDDSFDKLTKKLNEVADDMTKRIDETAKSSVDSIKQIVDEAEHKLEVSAQEVLPDMKRIDNIEETGKADSKSWFEGLFNKNPAESLHEDNKKASKAQNAFQSSLMEYLGDKFEEILQRLDKNDNKVPVPIPISFPNNPASMESI